MCVCLEYPSKKKMVKIPEHNPENTRECGLQPALTQKYNAIE